MPAFRVIFFLHTFLLLGLFLSGCSRAPSDPIQRANEEAIALLESGNYPEAVAVFQRAVAEWPHERRLWLNLAQALILSNRIGEAMAAYESAIKISQDLGPSAQESEGRDRLIEYVILAVDRGESSRALEILNNLPSGALETPRIQLAHGFLEMAEKRYEKALSAFDKAISLWISSGQTVNPDKPWGNVGITARVGKITALAALQGRDDEIDSILEELKNEKLSSSARTYLANSLLAAGRYEEALQQAQAATAEAPEQGRGWHLQALALEGMGKTDEAIPPLLKATTANHKDPEAVLHYAAIMLERGLEEEAMNALESLMDSLSRDEHNRDASSIAGQMKQAAAVQTAIGSIYAHRGQRIIAQDHLIQALKLDPGNQEAINLYTQITGKTPPQPISD